MATVKSEPVSNQYWKIHTSSLLQEALLNPGTSILSKPFNILGKVLFVLADRARELNDPELNSILLRLTLYQEADPENENYKPEVVEEYLTKYSKKFFERLAKME
jgi:hypothetical protein